MIDWSSRLVLFRFVAGARLWMPLSHRPIDFDRVESGQLRIPSAGGMHRFDADASRPGLHAHGPFGPGAADVDRDHATGTGVEIHGRLLNVGRAHEQDRKSTRLNSSH